VHSGIQSKKEPFVFSTIVFRDIENSQLEVIAVDVERHCEKRHQIKAFTSQPVNALIGTDAEPRT
jgi:hypothetical protein